MVRVPDAKSDCSRRGEAEMCTLAFKTTWSDSRRGKAEVRILNFKATWSEFHHLPRVGPKHLGALAHLGCTRDAGTS